MLKIGRTKMFVIIPSKLTFAKLLNPTGNIAKLVAILRASELASTLGSLIFSSIFERVGAREIIANIHKKDN